ncbi:MAG: flavodoxin family protein, partial [Candidatus Hermodarchaeia archaeon]
TTSFEKACKDKDIDFLGCYNCQGNPSPQLTKSMKAGGAPLSDDELRDYFEEVTKHPNSEDLQKAKEFARTILQKFR